MTVTTTAIARTIIAADGAGGARCQGCHSSLDYSWLVRYCDGSYAHLCSTCLNQQS